MGRHIAAEAPALYVVVGVDAFSTVLCGHAGGSVVRASLRLFTGHLQIVPLAILV